MAQSQDVRSRLPPPFNTSDETFDLTAQGAESLLYKTTFLTPGQPAALKVRPEKKWRHPTLDKRLTRSRILAEARVLVKLSGSGGALPLHVQRKLKVKSKKSGGDESKQAEGGTNGDAGSGRFVPAVLGLDWEAGWLVTEWIEGKTIKQAIYDRPTGQEDDTLKALLRRMGEVVGKLHMAGIVHGDLTTSNMMLKPSTSASAEREEDRRDLIGDVILIDFGLATQSVSDEDRAVDLYVLERAFGSTHPKEEGFFDEVLKAYGESMGKGGKVVLRRLEDVRMRGRKKSMIG